jgi:hypothetical protein
MEKSKPKNILSKGILNVFLVSYVLVVVDLKKLFRI